MKKIKNKKKIKKGAKINRKNILTFPKDFWWGAAYASHQVEGNNTNNNWWRWEQQGGSEDSSGRACDSWNLFRRDHDLVEELGLKSFRLSLEWSRIEPSEGKFDKESIEHYRTVLRDLKKRGVKTTVTLWHWTLPLWLVDKYGGWHNKKSIKFFVRYCKKVVEELGEEIDLFLILNEPNIPLNKGYLNAEHPPGKRNPWLFWQATKNMIQAYKDCYDITKKINPDLPVGFTQHASEFVTPHQFWGAQWLIKKIESFSNWHFYFKIEGKFDFVGINYYTGHELQLKKPFRKPRSESIIFSDMGWGFSPRGIYEVIMDAKERFPQKPIYILENGAADAEDKIREEYIRGHLKWIHQAIEDGADVRGYFHWSLLDNFEWQAGFWPRFGLCEMDYQTMERKPRKSFYYYQKVIRENKIEV
ncbi:MAG TPA: glycoside hydrolase family 1 protein [Candidatus Moranbacteria bacterium]|nr:glycoside hydrolase family 1 protein [Candidatus Moranbacteria bacterium]